MFSSILILNPPAHTRLRRVVSASFTARRMAGLRRAVERIVADACEQIAGDQADRLRAEPLLAIPAVEELLRYDSPVQTLSGRSAPGDLIVAGLDLSDGQQVLAMLGAANRDAAVFSDPDRLILDRAQQAPLSFRGGIHYCLGAPLARLEAQVALPALLARFPRLALAGEPVSREGHTLHGHASLPISAR